MPEGLVDRRAREDRGGREQGDDVGPGEHLADPHHALAFGRQPVDEALHLRRDLLGVRSACAEHQLHLRRQLGGRPQEQREPLLAGDPADEDHARAVRVDTQLAHPSRRVHRLPVLGVDPVVYDVHPAGVDGRVAAEDVVAHRGADPDHRVGCFVRRPLGPAGHGVPAAELLGLPRAHRLEAVRGHHVRGAVQQRGEVAGHVGVPGVRVHDLGPFAAAHHLEVHPERADRRVGVGQSGRVAVRRGAGLGALLPEAVHARIDPVLGAQRPDQLGHVHPRASVDIRRVLTRAGHRCACGEPTAEGSTAVTRRN